MLTILTGGRFGEETFRAELLEQMSGQIGRQHGGSERQGTAMAKAERVLAEELRRRGWNDAELSRQRKADGVKLDMAQRLRSETTMTSA